MRGLSDFLSEFSLSDALVEELFDPNDWLPPPLLEAAIVGHVDPVAEAFTAKAALGAALVPRPARQST